MGNSVTRAPTWPLEQPDARQRQEPGTLQRQQSRWNPRVTCSTPERSIPRIQLEFLQAAGRRAAGRRSCASTPSATT